jgi:raffinose/stachyose/melibiose transport system permease protein
MGSGEIMQKNTGWKVVSYFIMIFFTILTVGPLVWLFYSSMKPHADIIRNVFALPTGFYAQNYERAWRLANLGVLILNSVFYSSITTVAVTFLALMTGYGFAKFGYKISRVFFYFYTMGLLIVVNSIIVPLFLLIVGVRLNDTRLGVLIPYIGFGLPFMVFLAFSYIKGIPDSLQEAAVIDGASYLRIFSDIIIPMSIPVAATMLIFQFLNVWNELIIMYVLTSRPSLQSLPVGLLSFAGGRTRDYGLQFAALVIATIPMIAFYILFHNQLAKGFAAGALKE